MRQGKLNVLTFVMIITSLFSCAKDDADHSNNFLTASINFSSGDSRTFTAKGDSVTLSCGLFGSSIIATGNDIRRVTFFVSQGRDMSCVSSKGAFYQFSCLIETHSVIYNNISNDSRNELTFTEFRDDYWEGYFTTTCYSETDSLFVTGTFKGDPRLF
jgi:hypothetical protein